MALTEKEKEEWQPLHHREANHSGQFTLLDLKIFSSLLLSREAPNCYFFKDYLPLDIFKEILIFANILNSPEFMTWCIRSFVKYGKMDLLQMLLDCREEIEREDNRQIKNLEYNEKYCAGTTTSFWAAEFGQMDILKMLMQRNKNWSKSNAEGTTPLWMACANGHLDIVKLLVEKGMNPLTPNPATGQTPIEIALLNGHASTALFLESVGGHWIQDDFFFYSCCVRGHVEVVRIYLKRNPKFTLARDRLGNHVVHGAAGKGKAEVVKLLLSVSDPNVVNQYDKNGTTPLIQAIISPDQHDISYLLELKADPDGPDFLGTTPLIHSVKADNKKAFKSLLSYANLELADPLGNTPLMIAAQYDPYYADLLLEEDIDVDRMNDQGISAIFYAVMQGSAVLVKKFLEKKADHTVCHPLTKKNLRDILIDNTNFLDPKECCEIHHMLENGGLFPTDKDVLQEYERQRSEISLKLLQAQSSSIFSERKEPPNTPPPTPAVISPPEESIKIGTRRIQSPTASTKPSNNNNFTLNNNNNINANTPPTPNTSTNLSPSSPNHSKSPKKDKNCIIM